LTQHFLKFILSSTFLKLFLLAKGTLEGISLDIGSLLISQSDLDIQNRNGLGGDWHGLLDMVEGVAR
jgi:hypothetical protein